jgi:UDP-2,3-diacylglucosamine hydrolase
MNRQSHYAISDLHLSVDEPALTELFIDFLEKHSPYMQSLDILGDLFDAWIGDDDDSEFIHIIASQLAEVADHCRIRFAHGNRDFLLGSSFAKRAGFALLPEVSADGSIVLCHGDHLCSDDLAYMQFRLQTRNPQWQEAFLKQSLESRRAFASSARAQSKQNQQHSTMEIMDINATSLASMMQQFPRQHLIHGHTHRPGVFHHAFGMRIVLGDWRIDQPSYLQCTDDNFELIAHGQRWQGALAQGLAHSF